MSSLWSGRLPAAQKPQTENPAKGYIVASNQRIVDNDVHSQAFVGFEAAKPWRALRIDQRVRETLDAGKPTADALLAIQQDSLQLEAAELAPIYGAHCPKDAEIDGHDKQRVIDFCDSIAAFDGVYSVDANAIAYARLHRELQLEVFDAHVSTELAEDLVSESFSSAAWNDLVKREHAGEISAAFFDDPRTGDREGLDGFMLRATKRALDILVADGMGSKGDWRWGNWHKLSLRGA